MVNHRAAGRNEPPQLLLYNTNSPLQNCTSVGPCVFIPRIFKLLFITIFQFFFEVFSLLLNFRGLFLLNAIFPILRRSRRRRRLHSRRRRRRTSCQQDKNS